jgi:hypothetical protein
MELEGTIIRKLNVQSGVTAKGPWAKQEFVVEYKEGNYPATVCMNVWGEDKVRDLEKFPIGAKVKVSFNLSSREYNGKWYTDIRAWKMLSADAPVPQAAPAAPQMPAAPMPSADDMPFYESESDFSTDLPF